MRWIDPPDGRPWALIALCGASLLFNVVLVANNLMRDSDPEPEAVALVADQAPVLTEAVAEPTATEQGTVVDAEALVVLNPDGTPMAAPPPAPVLPEGMTVLHAEVSHSLARTFQKASPEHADVLSAIYARLFFWDLDLRRDLQKGDEVAVAYEWQGEWPEIPVATYHSLKLGKTLSAYRYKATGDAFASWWDAEGLEASRRLVNSPMKDYEQVTSLIKDRPTHKGMDFKAPVGTSVVSPKAGSVVRTDWNHAYNGNCVEVRYSDGTLARFLHLSRTDVKAGDKVGAGQALGLSGNTGRSTAPHLHYELEKGGKVIDPVDYHGVTQRTLPAGDRLGFEAEVVRLQAMLSVDS